MAALFRNIKTKEKNSRQKTERNAKNIQEDKTEK